jgi:ribosomal-protein-alanine N-acetyltransferase
MIESKIDLSRGYCLTSVREDDVGSYVQLLADGEIASLIPAIPQPYTPEVARWWVQHRLAQLKATRQETTFAIRGPEGRLIGSVGVDEISPLRTHNGELGYWLGREHRGRGLAQEAVAAFVTYAFGALRLERLTAHTLAINRPSIQLLEHSGFVLEGRLRWYDRTAAGLQDTLVFGLLRGEQPRG